MLQRSLAVEATVFWLVVSSGVALGAHPTSTTPGQFSLGAVVVGIFSLSIAYLCWKGRKFGFVAAIVLSLIVTVGAFPYIPPLYLTEDSPYGALIDALIIISNLQTVFFGLRALRETNRG